MNQTIRRIISDCIRDITITDLQRAAEESLWRFYHRQYAILSMQINGERLLLLWALLRLRDGSSALVPKTYTVQMAKRYVIYRGYDEAKLYGTPMKLYAKDYADKVVKPIVDRLCEDYARDPGDISGRNSLRNRAEMEARYDDHLQQISDLRNTGTRLVIASSHVDCSERCRPWQGRVYSLDGTSGTTDDGRRYIPLENATDVYYTTRAGKTYKNGLLGFNCRHYLIAYKPGYHQPMVVPAVERREYAITQRQRAMERHVRDWTTRALYAKGVDPNTYKYAKGKAKAWNDAYIAFSKRNGRAYYPSRTKIL